MVTKVQPELIDGFHEAIADAVAEAVAGAGGVTSVNGRTGAVTGLAETSDVAAALADKADKATTYTISETDDLLADKADSAAVASALADKADASALDDYATLTGAQTLENKTLDAPVISGGYAEACTAFNSGSSAPVDLANGSTQFVTLTANWTPSAFPAPAAGKGFVLFIKQDATGGRTITFPASVKWPAGTVPTLTATASKADKFAFQAFDGNYWIAHVVGQNYL